MHKGLKVFVACGGILCWISAATAAGQEEALLAVPSGLPLTALDPILESQPDGSSWARFRFVAPELAEDFDYLSVADDFAHLCTKYALPQLGESVESISQIVISLSSQDLEFGATRPDVIQFFEAFSVNSDRCIWEAF